MLERRTSIKKLLSKNPDYSNAVSRTFYGGGKSATKKFSTRLLNDESQLGDDDMFELPGESGFFTGRNSRNKSVSVTQTMQKMLKNGSSDLDLR